MGNTKKSTTFEKAVYGIGDIGQAAFIYTFSTCFMTIFYTNSVGISSAVVGTMMLVCRFLDGITDVIMGVILEKTHTRFGKCRPWYLVAGITMGISLILCFIFPAGLSDNGKVIYMYLTYILLNCISYTIFSITHNAMLSRMSTDPADQNKIATIRLISSTLAANVIYYITTAAVNSLGGMNDSHAWAVIASVYGIMGGILVCLIFVFVKEKVKDDVQGKTTEAESGKKKETVSTKTAFLATVKNKEFFLLLAIWFCVYCISGAQSGSGTYYIGYVLGDWNAAGWFSIGNMICQLAAMLAVPFILTKVDKIKMMRCRTGTCSCDQTCSSDRSVQYAALPYLKLEFCTVLCADQCHDPYTGDRSGGYHHKAYRNPGRRICLCSVIHRIKTGDRDRICADRLAARMGTV